MRERKSRPLTITIEPIESMDEYQNSLSKAMLDVAERMYGEEVVYEVIQRINEKDQE